MDLGHRALPKAAGPGLLAGSGSSCVRLRATCVTVGTPRETPPWRNVVVAS